MRRALLFISFLTMVLAMWAGDVSPEQALKQAQNFVQRQVTAGRRAPGATPQLALKGTVSGLYVFNVADDEGFVIVSNDDRTFPVLGYSDSGSIDPDNMPANMRAWLQGYADEIAWMNEHNIQPASQSSSRRTNRSVKTPITPLVQTQWNQGAPYNNLTPYYGLDSNYYYIYSTTGGDGWSHCATGCVATAMAQVMKYHQWPTSTITDIPSYSWYDYTLGPLPPVTFDWANMQNTYSGNETGTTATAIATLMQYCGYSVEMDYGPESGSNTKNAATALINYFGYKSTTTVLNRSWYSYANWIELIYNELLENRPVLYCGQSAEGGHAFICDGYQSEDYFHINWGWSGMSDNYFKLSALDPDEQGIGGSSSTDGYHFGQEAIVGIQKPSENGTVLNVPKNDNSITCTNMTFSANPTRYQEVTVTLTIQNTSQNDDYDGDIGLRIRYLKDETYYIVEDIRNNFFIPKNSSKDIVIIFTPEYAGTYSLRAFKPYLEVGLISYICDSYNLEVADGEKPSTNPKKTDIYLQVPSNTMENFVQEGSILLGAGSNIVMKGNLTVYNPDAEYDYDGYFEWGLRNSSNQLVSYKSTSVTIPSQDNITIPFEIDGLTNNSTYTLQFTNYRGKDTNGQNVWTGWQTIQSVTTRTGIAITKADGTIELTPSETSYTAPQDALSVELTGTDVESVTPNSNPNCLYIIDKAVSGLGGKNVITYDGDSYTAANISLTDGSDFYSPVDFTAENIEYTYDYEGKAGGTGKAADGTNGWSTIMLPYDVTSVTANGTAIDWFHSETDGGGQFWLKKFTDDSDGTVFFDYVEENGMKAYTPYIIALPGNRWGASHQLNDKTIKFIGTNVTVYNGSTLSTITGSNYRFIGKTVTDGTENIYCLNADGNQFELNASDGSKPFRAYFKADTFDRTMTSLAIGSGSGTTGIQTFEPTSKPHTDSWYTLDGRRISGQPTQKGLYIVNGKKTVIK